MRAVRYAAELAIGDTVRTPSGRLAHVTGHPAGRVALQYVEPDTVQHLSDEVVLQANLLVLVQQAAPQPLPRGFFAGDRR